MPHAPRDITIAHVHQVSRPDVRALHMRTYCHGLLTTCARLVVCLHAACVCMRTARPEHAPRRARTCSIKARTTATATMVAFIDTRLGSHVYTGWLLEHELRNRTSATIVSARHA